MSLCRGLGHATWSKSLSGFGATHVYFSSVKQQGVSIWLGPQQKIEKYVQ